MLCHIMCVTWIFKSSKVDLNFLSAAFCLEHGAKKSISGNLSSLLISKNQSLSRTQRELQYLILIIMTGSGPIIQIKALLNIPVLIKLINSCAFVFYFVMTVWFSKPSYPHTQEPVNQYFLFIN